MVHRFLSTFVEKVYLPTFFNHFNFPIVHKKHERARGCQARARGDKGTQRFTRSQYVITIIEVGMKLLYEYNFIQRKRQPRRAHFDDCLQSTHLACTHLLERKKITFILVQNWFHYYYHLITFIFIISL